MVQKICLAHTDQTLGCVTIVWCSHWKNHSTLFENIISVGNMPLSDFSFPLWNGARTVNYTKFFFFYQCNAGQRAQQSPCVLIAVVFNQGS
uniref:Uncharacterized protein n=1 Tax=Prolemur simus TaxID=1328070 RepID=A0A8C9ANL4_PROSS